MFYEIRRIWGQFETMVNVSGQSIGYVTAITRLDTKYYKPLKSVLCSTDIFYHFFYESNIYNWTLTHDLYSTAMPTNLAEDLAFRKAQIRHLEKIEFLSLRTQFLADNGDADAVIWSTHAKSVKTNTSELFASENDPGNGLKSSSRTIWGPYLGSLTHLGPSRKLQSQSQKFCIYKRGPFWAIFWPSLTPPGQFLLFQNSLYSSHI